jgi:hypothetical protein
MVLSTVVPMSLMGVDSLEKMRLRFYCIDIFHFKIYLLLSPSTSGHHPLSLTSFHYLPSSKPVSSFINEGNPSSIIPFLSRPLDITHFPSLVCPPPNAAPDFGLSGFSHVNSHTNVFMDADSFDKTRSWTSFILTPISYFQISSIVDK